MATGDTAIWIGNADTGPDDPSTPGNWDTGVVPLDGEHAVIPAGITEDHAIAAGDIRYDAGTNPRALSTFTVAEGYDQTVGSPAVTDVDLRYLKITADTVTFAGGGESYLWVEGASRILVSKAGTSAATGEYSLDLTCVDETTTLDIQAGSGQKIGIAALPGEQSSLTTINVSGGEVTIGSDVTVDTLNVTGGIVRNLATIASGKTINVYGGVLDQQDDCVGSVNIRGGVMYYRGTGTIANVIISGQGVMDLSLDRRGRTFTATKLYYGAALRDPWTTVTHTNKIQLIYCGLDDVTLDLGDHVEFAPTAL